MSYSPLDEFWLRVGRSQIPEYSAHHVIGYNEAVGTTFVPIARGGLYQTPTSAQALEVVSSDANDTAAGTGARTVTIKGLDANWNEVTQTVSMNGTTAVALGTNLIRAFEMYVATSGTYGTQTAPSHVGTITLQGSGGGVTWLQIYAGTFPRGATQCGVYTVPTGKSAFIYIHFISVEANKPATLILLKRENADTVAAPYGVITGSYEFGGLEGSFAIADIAVPEGPFVGPCDIGFMGKFGTGTGAIALEMELVIFDT